MTKFQFFWLSFEDLRGSSWIFILCLKIFVTTDDLQKTHLKTFIPTRRTKLSVCYFLIRSYPFLESVFFFMARGKQVTSSSDHTKSSSRRGGDDDGVKTNALENLVDPSAPTFMIPHLRDESNGDANSSAGSYHSPLLPNFPKTVSTAESLASMWASCKILAAIELVLLCDQDDVYIISWFKV